MPKKAPVPGVEEDGLGGNELLESPSSGEPATAAQVVAESVDVAATRTGSTSER